MNRLENLYTKSADKKCFYCGKVTKLYPKSIRGMSFPNGATVEHIYHRHHPKRGKVHQETVLSCYECNVEKSHRVEEAISNRDLQAIIKEPLYKRPWLSMKANYR